MIICAAIDAPSAWASTDPGWRRVSSGCNMWFYTAQYRLPRLVQGVVLALCK